MNSKNRTAFIVLLTIIVVFLSAFCYLYFVRLQSAGFSQGDMVTMSYNDGAFMLSWDNLSNKRDVEYIVKVYEGAGDKALSEEPIYSFNYKWWDYGDTDSGKASEYSLKLPSDIIFDSPKTIYINTKKIISIFGIDIGRKGKAPIVAKYIPSDTAAFEMDYEVDVPDNKISFTCDRVIPGIYRLDYSVTTENEISDKIVLDEAAKDDGEIAFVEEFGGDTLPMPQPGERYTFTVTCKSAENRLIIGYGNAVLDREDFLTDKINVTLNDDGKNRYILTWNETKGEGYKVSCWDDSSKDWQKLREYSLNDDRTYETDKLEPCRDYRYRIEAVGTPTDIKDEDRISEVDIHTGPSAEYSSVWPTQELSIYKDSTGDDSVGTIGVLQCVTALEEKDGRFLIQTGADDDSIKGYIDSNKCMINLPDYIGDLCRYDITNSYCSIYCAHTYGIPAVSGTVVKGYENVLLDDGTFLVPLLYPVAKKLVPAAEEARKQGYVIKIYDSFRPYVATRSIYDLSYEALNYVVPEYGFSRITLSEYRSGKSAGVLSLSNLKKAEPLTEEKKDEDKDSKKSKKRKKASKAKKKSTEAKVVYNENTYAKVMLNDGAYNLGAFLAASGSMHNLGIAMDMTIEDIDTGEELVMQSAMHDLSYHSVQAANNDNANTLKNIMMPCGFSMITSEWWHFQDNDVRDTLKPASVQNGVSIEGFKKDDKGWRYKRADGSYFKNTTEDIDGDSYSFDEEGYIK
ncbi:MAG: hypothetical protein IJ661_03825 [Lachnospiraceae bacterium]|nr:hypothetical protein [Lachnospiraceae bacterium]